jgi:hypothetical protein
MHIIRSIAVMATVTAMAAGTAIGCGESKQSNDVLPGVNGIVFAKRAYVTEDGSHDVAGGAGQVIDYLRYTPGGGVFVLSPPSPDGEPRSLTSAFKKVDIAGLDLSFDAKEVVFSMRHADDDHYHVYTAKVNGGGKPKQLTFGDYDDVRPIYIPGERIAFVTNEPYTEMGRRADEYGHSRQVTQLATISSLTGDAERHVCSQNLSHTADPFLMSDGSIGYSRWEHLGPVNDVKLFHMNPDCTDMLAVAGQHTKDFNSIVQVREASDGVLVGIATSREGTIQAGAVMQVDARARVGSAKLDEQHAQFTSLTPKVPTDMRAQVPRGVGRYRTPFMLDDGQLLVSWANGDVNERVELAQTAPEFGIYRYNPKSEARELVYDDPNMWDLYAMPLRERAEPPVRRGRVELDSNADAAYLGAEAAVLGSIDIRQTSLDETISGAQFGDGVSLADALKEAVKVRIIEGFSSEIGPVRQFGLTMHEGAAILGEAPVQADGSWEAHVVPYLPYHLQPIDQYGLAIRNQLLWIQAMPGENRTCGGCHESRADAALATPGATQAQQLPLADKDYSLRTIAERTELPWYGAVAGSGPTVQDVLDAKCVSCHDGGSKDPFAGKTYTVTIPAENEGDMPQMYEVPYLLLSSAPVDIFYEREVVSYPASYVSLLYPSAMMGDSTVDGEMPPVWVAPGSARASRLIEKINATPEGANEGKKWAWDSAAHPEDVGVTLTREERLTLIRMADLGGQYYSRRNVEGAAEWAAQSAAQQGVQNNGKVYP